MYSRLFKSAAAVTALAVASLAMPLSVTSADAGYRGWRAPGYHVGPPRHHHFHRHHRSHRHYHGGGSAAAAAVLGLTAGAIIGGALSAPRAAPPAYHPPAHYPPAHYPPVHHYADDAPAPGSAAWYRYCAEKYRSFDPTDGTFQPYEGPRRVCQ